MMLKNKKTWFLAIIFVLLAPQLAVAACYETRHTPATTSCSSRDTSGSADFQGACRTTPAKTEQVEVECAGRWVNTEAAQLVGKIITQTATCASAGLRPATVNGHYCASGERRPELGEGVSEIYYRYGKKGGGHGEDGGYGGKSMSVTTLTKRRCGPEGETCPVNPPLYSTYCYSKDSNKRFNNKGDIVVAFWCE